MYNEVFSKLIIIANILHVDVDKSTTIYVPNFMSVSDKFFEHVKHVEIQITSV